MKMRVADYILQFLEQQGVNDVFLLSGGGIMHLTDGLANNKNINVTCFHHEQAEAMAMDAYARISGKFGVGYFTTGPGATNAITGCAGAWLDSVPCLFISGQTKRKESVYNLGITGLRQVGVQEINILPIIQSITKYSAMINYPEDIRFVLEQAIYLAKSGRPGPVWLDIPVDVQGAIIDTDTLIDYTPPKQPPAQQDTLYEKLSFFLKESKRPVILAGQGVRISGAIQELLLFASMNNIPIVTTYLGIDIIDSASQNYVGRVGIKGDRAGNFAVQNADVLLVIGSSLPVAETGYDYENFAPKAKRIVVDIDRTAHKKNMVAIDLMFESDAKEFLNQTSKICKEEQIRYSSQWLNRCIAWREKYPVNLPEYKNREQTVNIYPFIDVLCQKLTSHDIIVTDAGSAFFAGSQAVKIKQGMRYITSGGFATMGFGIPASIGACIAARNQRVICITGDGSFQQNLQELQTIVHYNLPIKIFVLNNQGYLSIRITQTKLFDGRLVGEGKETGVSFPNISKIAYAYDLPFYRISKYPDLHNLDYILNCNEPSICEVVTPYYQEIIPAAASYRKDDGTMESKPLEDMFPFLPRDEFNENMNQEDI
jgi:acetolactate synthase-1/2/3 large subunit